MSSRLAVLENGWTSFSSWVQFGNHEGPRRGGIMGDSEDQNEIPSLISLPSMLLRGWLPQKVLAGIPRLWKDQMYFLIQKKAGKLGLGKGASQNS